MEKKRTLAGVVTGAPDNCFNRSRDYYYCYSRSPWRSLSVAAGHVPKIENKDCIKSENIIRYLILPEQKYSKI